MERLYIVYSSAARSLFMLYRPVSESLEAEVLACKARANGSMQPAELHEAQLHSFLLLSSMQDRHWRARLHIAPKKNLAGGVIFCRVVSHEEQLYYI